MFQNFDAPSRAEPISGRLVALRARLADAGLTGFLVPHADEYQGEYIPASAERLAWLTGFTGSAGAAVVLANEAAVFVDGRYTLQARNQMDSADFSPESLIDNPPHAWLKGRLKKGDRLGYDPRLLTLAETRRFESACAAAGAAFVALDENPIDAIWADRPAPPLAQVSIQPDELAGETASAKIERLRTILAEKDVAAAIIAQSDSIAWTFNIRGADVPHNPVALSYALLRREGPPTLYMDGRKLSNAVRDALAGLADIKEERALLGDLAALGREGARVLADPQSTPAILAQALTEANGTIVEGSDPAVLPKARKNAIELDGSRRAHRRDGVAVTRFLAWFNQNAGRTPLTEIAVARKLEAFRAETGAEDGMPLLDLSFDTIAGTGPDGAIVHYRVNEATDRALENDTLFLIDSGAQFRDGTTDITRTIAIGTPTDEMRQRFTLVLKGHIALATARFPKGTTGAQLDTLARHALWQAGLDFDHGTGHGVGVFLSVHEGPARISKSGTVPLEPGMILSNEPGYYKTDSFGIRIENLIVVTPPAPIEGGEREMLGFETITLAPIDRRLVDTTLLSRAEIAWFDAYHARVREALAPSLSGEALDFLVASTQPLAAVT
ncbi:aminopeptidase P family protein [Kaistia dalseonensis]|uniref:Xaa-Pro aminopeptidase n=1 Tax=Kaistia dalseonensis TaxID=410840 RepID=A0ABU0HBR0_9HYPH|nr:aminopeptidase P family protein [Kaistia dalseonensis]MCX5497121.1 aminopeptidase P family protein [Kaistia dalseonensis]MDQ0439748.1 Xaa-Pro aminopeptidase [Kaistia dalseonensis]